MANPKPIKKFSADTTSISKSKTKSTPSLKLITINKSVKPLIAKK